MAKTTPRVLCLALFVTACGVGTSGDLTKSVDDITICPGSSTVQGIDVSEWQGGIDWGAVKRSGRVFAYARVGDGFYRDRTFGANYPAIKAAGLLRGVYQYFEPGLDAVVQANIVIEAVGGHLGAGDLPPMLDMEYAPGGMSAGAILHAMHSWTGRIESALGKKPVIYTGGWWWNPRTGDSAQFAGYPLADSYYSQSCPNIAAGWSSWAFWQYSSSGSVAGIRGRVDLDTFNGPLEALQDLAGETGGPPPPPPPPSGPCSGRVGRWCGSELGLDKNVLYRCDRAPEAHEVAACHYGCHVNPPNVDDACNPAPPPKGPCTGRARGLYCGSEIGLAAATLYSCEGSDEPSGSRACAAGCKVNPPGVDDACKVPPGPCSGKEPGLWCGSAIGLDASTLYTCNGDSEPSDSQTCDYGCAANAPGVNDACTAPPRGPCSGHDLGFYCGSALGLDASTLYSCDGDPQPSNAQPCDNGCQVNPPGEDDACKDPPGPCSGRKPGLWCGSEIGLDPDTLYTCAGGNDISDLLPCDEGCRVNPPGVNDQCFAASCSGRSDGAYCGTDRIHGNPALLYQCVSGQVDSYDSCSGACVVEPPGTGDYCQ